MEHLGTSTIFKFGSVLDLRTADSALADTWTQTASALARSGVMAGSCGTGFAFGSLIETPDGWVPVEQLMVGDLVTTADNGPVAIKSLHLSEHRSTDMITIQAGAFDNDLPLTLRADHHFVVTTARAELLFGENEVLVRAADIVDHYYISRGVVGGNVACVSIGLAQHEIVRVNGIDCEAGVLGNSGYAARPILDADEAMVLHAPLETIGYRGTAYALAAR